MAMLLRSGPGCDTPARGKLLAVVTAADLEALEPRDHRADFHCVTTWSVTGLIWRGVRLRDVFASLGITEGPAPYLVARSGDRRKALFVWEDAIADDVLLATHLNGGLLDDRHGAPLRPTTAPSSCNASAAFRFENCQQ